MSQPSPNSPIPWAALKNHVAILGKTGSGKTSVAKSGIVEPALDNEERVCVIDPTGAWWGLRSTATGKRKGYPIAIFGGEHGDYPLSVAHAETIAEAIGTSSTPTVIDTFKMTIGERTEFFTRFANKLLRSNKGPLYLVIDECHLFMPQGKVLDPRSGAMLHAANNLVSLGRSRGLRITLISQRPAKVHKDSLTQVESMIAMRVTAPHDRGAFKDWMMEQADEKTGEELIPSLPGLADGEAWVWCPGFNILKRHQFARPKTFDSSAAPDGEGGDVPVLAPIDLDALKGKLAKVEEQKKADDPIALRAEIERLKRELRYRVHDDADIKVQNTEIERLRDEADKRYSEGHKVGFLEGAQKHKEALVGMFSEMENAWNDYGRAFGLMRNVIDRAIKAVQVDLGYHAPSGPPTPHVSPAPRPARQPRARPAAATEPSAASGGEIRNAARKVLDALAWWDRMGFSPVDRKRACIASGLKPTASTFGVYVGELIRDGYIVVVDGGLQLTLAGSKYARWPEAEPSRDGLRAMVQELLKPQAANVFNVVYEKYPDAISRDDLADEMNLSRTASTLGVYLGQVIAIGAVENNGRGTVKAADWLFP
jgi:Helicase HerA, central domain